MLDEAVKNVCPEGLPPPQTEDAAACGEQVRLPVRVAGVIFVTGVAPTMGCRRCIAGAVAHQHIASFCRRGIGAMRGRGWLPCRWLDIFHERRGGVLP